MILTAVYWTCIQNGNNTVKQKPPRKKRRVFNTIILVVMTLVFVVLVALITAGLMVLHQPKAYQPRTLSKEHQQLTEKQGKDQFTNMYNDIQRLETFKVSYNQQLINDLLMLDDVQASYQQQLSQVEQYFKYAQFAFDSDRIYLMGQASLDSINAVVTITFVPKVTADGKLEIELESIKAGALSVPASMVLEQLQQVVSNVASGSIDLGTLNHYYIDDKRLEHDWAGLVKDLINTRHVSMDAILRTMDDKQVRIDSIRSGQGNLELTLSPIYIGK